jgi:serine/threonine protein kinase
MTSPTTPPSGQPDPAALLALGLATQTADAPASSTPPLTPAELAAEFPRLEIFELLGRGGMGAVYKARQRDLDRLVALKILRPGLDADPGFAERFTREARALAQLNHPGIVTLYEFGKTSAGRYFILMEFVDGMNLRQLLAAGRLSPREALAIVPLLCDALQYAHDRGLIHRDIKPENLLIDRLGRIKIADFGIAKITTTDPTSAIGHWSLNIGHSAEGGGTPAYMAPEQRTHPAAVDHRADLYALGVVFYQMLTGELPAAGQLRPPSTRVQLDVRLDEIVLRALEKDPARRYAAASEFRTQVETVAASNFTHSSNSNFLKKRFQRIVSSHWFRFLPVVLMLVILISIINRNASSPNPAQADSTTGAFEKKSVSPPPQNLTVPAAAALPDVDLAKANEPPRLRALNWLDQPNNKTAPAWLATGEPVPATEQLPEFSGIVDQSNPDARYLGLWFSHPLFDQQSHAKITLLDHTGAPLPPPGKSLSWQTQSVPPSTNRAEGWIILTSRLSHFDDTPKNLIARLDYSLGAWTYTKEIPVTPHITHTEVLTDGTVIGSPGQNAAGKAFIETSFNPKSVSQVEQLDFVAITHDGRRLNRTSGTSQGYDELHTKRFVFDIPLSEVRAFAIRTRPIRTTEWTVPLRSTRIAPALAALKRPSLQLLLEASPVTLPELAAQIRPLLARYFPAATITDSSGSFDAHFATQEFTLHTILKSGAIRATPHMETGPSENGFILKLERLDQPYVGAAVLPSLGEKPYWKTFTNAGFEEARSTGVHVRLLIGSKLPKAFHEEIMRLIGMIHLPRRSLTTSSGETLSVYTNAFLDENDLAAVEKISAPAPSSQLRLHLTEQGSFRLNQLSQLALGRRIAIMVNDQVVSAPKVMAELSGDEVEIIGLQSVGDESALLAAFPGPAPKLLTKTTNQALTWLQLVDEGRYAQSWHRSASAFRKAITEDQWTKQIESVRTSLGSMVARHLKSTEYITTLRGTPGGPHIVMQFQSRFAQKEPAVETVTFTREPDGVWRASGYFIK